MTSLHVSSQTLEWFLDRGSICWVQGQHFQHNFNPAIYFFNQSMEIIICTYICMYTKVYINTIYINQNLTPLIFKIHKDYSILTFLIHRQVNLLLYMNKFTYCAYIFCKYFSCKHLSGFSWMSKKNTPSVNNTLSTKPIFP